MATHAPTPNGTRYHSTDTVMPIWAASIAREPDIRCRRSDALVLCVEGRSVPSVRHPTYVWRRVRGRRATVDGWCQASLVGRAAVSVGGATV